MNLTPFKSSLLAAAVSASLAACGGGGGGDSAPVATPAPAAAPAPTGTTTTATAPNGVVLNAQTGSSSGSASNTQPALTVTPGLAPAPIVPAANTVLTAVPASTYASGSQIRALWSSIQDWRGQARFEEEGAFGVGLLTQRADLDTLATSLSTSQPDLISADTTLRSAAVTAAQAQMTALGYPVSYVVASTSVTSLPISSGNFCAKAMYSSLPGAEIGISGMRSLGLSVPESAGPMCVMLAGLDSVGSWQLPPTGSSSVYPFPGKQLTLPLYYGDWASLGFASQPGHAVHVSVASVDALPVAIPGAGSGAAIATSAITINEFTLKLAGVTVPARIFTRAGVQAASGVTLESTSQLIFPTSMVLIPSQPLTPVSVYTATFRGTVNGRTVTRTWDFTTSN
jgi:hypothetical protein